MELPAGVSTSTYTYAGTGYANPDAVTSIGKRTATTTYVYDTNGNLTSAGNGTATTTYAYDSLDNLASTTDASGNVRDFAYDGLSRRTSAEDLHSVGDGTFGTWSFTYDDQGNVTSQTYPKGQVVNRTYDALNRMLTEDYTGQAGAEVTLTYDNCTNGIG